MSDHTIVTNRSRQPEPWKWIALTLAAVMAAVLVFGIVTAYNSNDADDVALKTPAAVQRSEPRERIVVAEPARPASTDISYCNTYASNARTRGEEAVRNGIIGGAIGAGVGAATGAIADGGKGAGKGAGIGAIVGATAGTLYGLDKANRNSAAAEAAYRTCMAQRGF